MNVGLASLSGLARAVLAFATMVLIARALGPLGRGEFAFLTNLAGLISLLASAGASTALVAARRQRNWDDRMLLTAAFLITAVTGLPLAAGAALMGLVGELSLAAAIAVAAVPLITATSLVAQSAQVRSKYASVLASAAAGPGLALILLAAIWASGSLTTTLSIMIWAIAMIPGLLPVALPLRRAPVDHFFCARSVRRDEFVWFLRRSLSANVPVVAVLLLWRLDVLMIQWFLGSEDVGQYSIAVGIAETIMVLGIGLRSGVVAHLADAERSTVFSTIGPVVRLSAFGMICASVTLLLTAPLVIRLVFGPEYEPAVGPLRALALGVPLLVLHYPLVDLLIAIGRTASLVVPCLALVVFNGVSNAIVLTLGELWMVGATSSVTYLLLFFWVLVIARRDFPISPRQLLWPYMNECRSLIAVLSQRRMPT